MNINQAINIVHNSNTTNWDLRFLRLAKEVASWSKDPTSKVGCVLATGNILAGPPGFNGFPRGLQDDSALLNNRDIKWKRTIHAEVNAILHAKGTSFTTVYIYPFMPCTYCTAILIQCNISKLVTIDIDREWDRDSLDMLSEAGVSTIRYSKEEV